MFWVGLVLGLVGGFLAGLLLMAAAVEEDWSDDNENESET